VTAGDAQRIANRQCKVLFLLGADDGSIPQVTPGAGLLTDRDRELLEDYGLEMPPRAEEKLSRESTIVYTVCTQPTEKLFVTWPAGGEGEKRPSFLVERLDHLFPWADQICAPAPSPDQLRAMAAHSPQAREALMGDEALAATFRRLDRAAQWERGKLSAKAVKELYGEKVAMSASRLDQYKSCHFAYFLRFGLGAQDRRPAGFHAPEYGTFVHFVLEWVLRALREKDMKEVPPEEIAACTQEAVNSYVLQKLGGMENQTPRFRYLFRRLKKSVQAVVENVTDELRASDFRPLEFELGFGPGKELPPVEVKTGGITLRLSGFVDRVDGWVKDDRLYLRVVDYKTGRKSFDLTEVWNGLGLQMLLYLFTLEKRGAKHFGKETVPAGVLYLPARDAVAAGSREMSEAERKKVTDKELTRQGLILEDPQVVEAMEHPEGELRFLPLKVSKKTGQITGDALVSAEKLGRLNTHIQNILHDICREIAAGNIDADPFWRAENNNACQYCEFFRACHFEEGEGKDKRRWITTVKNKEFWEKLEENEGGGKPHGRETNP
jgi:ATP-dependent helicase/nuclease subunit B